MSRVYFARVLSCWARGRAGSAHCMLDVLRNVVGSLAQVAGCHRRAFCGICAMSLRRHQARGKVAPALSECVRRLFGREGQPGRAGARQLSLQGHEQCGQRKHERNPSAPLPRSPSSDSGDDASKSERARVVWWGRAIAKHWRSGAGGRAPACPLVAMEPAGSTALVAQPPRCSA